MYAIVELMGHRRFGARVTDAELAGAKMLRCEVLAFVEGRPPLLVQHVHPQALYAITECSEAQARGANQSTYAIQSPLAIEAPRPDDIPFDVTPPNSCTCDLPAECPKHDAPTPWAKCEYCDGPAACIASYEGDPWVYACNVHCGHGNEDGQCVPVDAGSVLELVNELQRLADKDDDSDEPAAPSDSENAQLRTATLWVSKEKFDRVLTADQPAIRVDSPTPTGIVPGDALGVRARTYSETRTVVVRVTRVDIEETTTLLTVERIEVRRG